MKLFKNTPKILIVFTFAVMAVLFLNLVLGIYPVLDLLKYLEIKKFYWTIPTIIILTIWLWYFNRSMRKKIIKERIDIFNATIRTIQDILHNSASSIQLLILDMKDDGVSEEIILKAEKNIEELKKVIQTLSAVDPQTIELKELNRNLSIIKMDFEN